jgi:L-iditol 2-dehydrogenase
MQAAFLHAPRDIRLAETELDAPGPGELRLDVTAVGVCGSDLHTFLHGNIGGIAAQAPLILGHEAAGRVAEIGSGLAGQFTIGQAVAIDPAIPCWTCEQCEHGHPNLCTRLKFIGLWPDHGALREQMIHPARSCMPLPDGMSPVVGALLEPLGVALHAIALAKLNVGDAVAVLGCGAIGLLLIRLARLAGAQRIFASDRYAWRLAMAREFGATDILDYSQTEIVPAIARLTGGRGVDVAIESAWVTDTATQCVESVRNGGRVVIVGIPVEDFITLRASPARRKGLTIKMARRMKHTYPAAIALAQRGDVPLEALASHRFSLAQTQRAFDTAADYADGVIRAMILPTQ